MKNPYIIPSLIIAAAILAGFWMLKPPSEPPTGSFYDAIGEGYLEVVRQHLAASPNVNAKNGNGRTPLFIAAERGHTAIAELLIANGADVNAKTPNSYTSLHTAAVGGHKETAELLIAKGADVNAKRDDGITPLDSAIVFNRSETADLLRKHGGKAKHQTSQFTKLPKQETSKPLKSPSLLVRMWMRGMTNGLLWIMRLILVTRKSPKS